MEKIVINGQEILLYKNETENDYIRITDLAKLKKGTKNTGSVISNWFRSKKVQEYLKKWEQTFNSNFDQDALKEIGECSLGNWIEKTGSNGVIVRRGKYGGTYAHMDIAIYFAVWLDQDVSFKLIKEHREYKQSANKSELALKRYLSKHNNKILVSAIQKYIIPNSKLPAKKLYLEYLIEADLVNKAALGRTSKEWAKNNPTDHLKGLSIRDCASVERLVVLTCIEYYNAMLIRKGVERSKRADLLKYEAEVLLKNLEIPLEKFKEQFETLVNSCKSQCGDIEYSLF